MITKAFPLKKELQQFDDQKPCLMQFSKLLDLMKSWEELNNHWLLSNKQEAFEKLQYIDIKKYKEIKGLVESKNFEELNKILESLRFVRDSRSYSETESPF